MKRYGLISLVIASLITLMVLGCSESNNNDLSSTLKINVQAYYNCKGMPDANRPAFTFSAAGPTPVPFTASNTTTTNGDGTITFDTTASAANTANWMINPFFSGTPSNLTLLFRAKWAGTGTNRGVEIDIKCGDNSTVYWGPRFKLVIRSNTDTNKLQVEKFDGTTTKNDTSTDTSQWHIYQINLSNITLQYYSNPTTLPSPGFGGSGIAEVFVDGNKIDALSCTVIQPTSINSFSFADGGSNPYRCQIDWIAWTTAAALPPSQVVLPNTLGNTTGYATANK